jgi:UDP-N-acetylmuramate--alanine ligase
MLDFKNIKTVHFTGIKGVGMTALACILADFGIKNITGSDLDEEFVTDEILAKKGIQNISNFSASKIEDLKPDLLIYTLAHSGEENEEVLKAKSLNIPALSQAQALGIITKNKKTIVVAGVGGKTTTSAWLSTVLENTEFNPSYMVGSGQVPSLKFPGKYNHDGQWMIVEGDEYKSSVYDEKPKFAYQNPRIVIIPNLSYDHPDVYKSKEDTLKAFRALIEKIPEDGALIINLDSKLNNQLLQKSNVKAKVFSYGQNSGEHKISNYKNNSFTFQNKTYQISVPGIFNTLNASAIILACQFLKINQGEIEKALLQFTGLKRRFELIFQKNNTFIYDDYAHHPDEISATLKSFRQLYPDHKLITIFQPHTFSRTKALLNQFSQCFSDTDVLLLTEIFASAREKSDDSIDSQILSEKININSDNCVYCSSNEVVINYLQNDNLENTIIITMGAGDVFKLTEKIQKLI